MDYTWQGGSGAFSDDKNWRDPNGQKGVPGQSDLALFKTGSGFTVTTGGATVGGVTLYDADKVTFSGGLTTGAISGGSFTLANGAFTTTTANDAQSIIKANGVLTLTKATVNGRQVDGSTGLTMTDSHMTLAAANGILSSLDVEGAVSTANSDVAAGYVNFYADGTIKTTTFTVRADTSLIDAGSFRLDGAVALTSVTVRADHVNLQGDLTWTGGLIDTADLTTNKVSGDVAATKLNFVGVTLTTSTFEASSATGALVTLDGGSWVNTNDWYSGAVTLKGGAQMTTGRFNADPDRTSGGTLDVSGTTTKFSSNGDFQASHLKITAGGAVDVAGNATVFGASADSNDVEGSGSLLHVGGKLTLNGANEPFILDHGAQIQCASVDMILFDLDMDDAAKFTVTGTLKTGVNNTSTDISLDERAQLSAKTASVFGGNFDLDGQSTAKFSSASFDISDMTLKNGGALEVDGTLSIGQSNVLVDGGFISADTELILSVGDNGEACSMAVTGVLGLVDVNKLSMYGSSLDVHDGGVVTVESFLDITANASISVHDGGILTLSSVFGSDDDSTITIGSGGTLRALDPVNFDQDIYFSPDSSNATLYFGDGFANLHAEIVDFHAGDVIRVGGRVAPGNLIVSHDEDAGVTTVKIDGPGAQDNTLVFKGDYDKSDFHFDWEDGTLTASAAIAGGSGKDKIVGTIGDDLLKGLAANDQIEAFAGQDTLDGGTGADTMSGGAGDDVYVVDNAGDVVKESGGGVDTVQSTITFSLAGQSLENLTLTGSAAVNGTGNSLGNVLTGNAGVNVLTGGAGNDTYYVQTVGDRVVEANGGGTDLVVSTHSFSLGGQYAEDLTLAGSASINATGNALANHLIGNAGANVLNGSTGADTMEGGAGNDTYVVDDVKDVVKEAGGGVDLVQSSHSFSLAGQALENLTLTGTGATSGTGNSYANVITGNTGANLLDGSTGADTLVGGAGNDTYVVDNVKDVVTESGGGTDLVKSSVDFTLAGKALENLTLTGSASHGTGNSYANVLVGNASANVLAGGLGADTLTGGSGHDYFLFDTTLGSTNVDKITDFVVADDTIRIDNAVFTGLSTGTLASSAFHIGTAAADGSDRIIYDSNTGKLFFDDDGAGGHAAKQFATIAAHLSLTNADFQVV